MPGRVGADEFAGLALAERHEVIQAHLSRRGLLRGAAAIAAGSAAGPLLWSGRASAADGAATPVLSRWLSFGVDPRREMTVCWQVPAAVDQPMVRFGPTSGGGGQLDGKAPGQLATVRPAAASGGPAPQYYARATMSGLEPGTAYTYQVGHTGGQSTTATFVTAPEQPERFRFTACGDQGPTASAAQVDAQIKATRPAFHLHAGDISYAEPSGQGTAVNDFLPGRWTDFFAQTDPVSSQVPWMFAPGNHEIEPVFGPDGYTGYRARIAWPDNGPATAVGVYTFRYGNVAVVSLDANDVSLEIPALRDYTKGAQTVWLGATLSQLRADPDVDFVVVFFHHCAYATDSAHGSDDGIRQAWAGVFDRYAVDLVINGHNHSCERSDPIRGGAATTAAPSGSDIHPALSGTTYVVVGGGGIGLTAFRSPDAVGAGEATQVEPVNGAVWQATGVSVAEQVTWSRARFSGYSFLTAEVDPGLGSGVASMRVSLRDQTGRELDSTTLLRSSQRRHGDRSRWIPAAVGGAAVVAAGAAGGVAYAAHRSRTASGPDDGHAESAPRRSR